MADDKKFYWIKLKDTFMTSDTVDFLMSQKSGANYVVLYQMLCLKTINTNGELARKIGEIIIPYDADKIQRDCKYFDIDTIRVALELYKQLGLIYMQEDSILKIANFENMIGSETAWAEKKRLYREKGNGKLESGQSTDNVLDNFRQEKEIRDKRLDKDIKKKDTHSVSQKEKAKRFIPPTLEEVESYCLERKNGIDFERFIDFYQSKDWYIGKNKMKDWKASIRTWESKNKSELKQGNFSQREYTDEQLKGCITDLENWG